MTSNPVFQDHAISVRNIQDKWFQLEDEKKRLADRKIKIDNELRNIANSENKIDTEQGIIRTLISTILGPTLETPIQNSGRSQDVRNNIESPSMAQTDGRSAQELRRASGHGLTSSGRQTAVPEPSTIHDASETTPTAPKYPIINKEHGSIVRINQQVVAISCPVPGCGANSTGGGNSKSKVKFLHGVAGLQGHIIQKHGDLPQWRGITADGVADKCTKLLLTQEDIRLVKAGRAPLTVIRHVSSDEASRGAQVNSILTSHPINHQPINNRYCHIIQIEGAWKELSCDYSGCGANYSPKSKSFYKGVKGFHNHLQQQHDLKGIKAEDALRHCHKRPVSDQDVALMTARPPQSPVHHRPCKRTFDEGSREEGETDYVPRSSVTLDHSENSRHASEPIRLSDTPNPIHHGTKRPWDADILREHFESPVPESSRTSRLGMERRAKGKAPMHARYGSIDDSDGEYRP